MSPARLHRRFSGRAGFTLLEMLAVLTLIGMAAALSFPLLRPPSDTLRIEEAARRMSGALRLARARAISRNEAIAVTVDVGRRSYTSAATGEIRLPPETAIQLKTAESERDGAQRGSFRFFPGGGATGGDIRLRLGEAQAHITVNWISGEARLAR